MRPYRIEGPKEIKTEQLLFWPNNPRLKISDFEALRYTDQQLLAPKNQENIFEQLRQHEHSVTELVDSMSSGGFMREKAPIVMKVHGQQKFLVLEGNRRLTAVRTLLGNSVAISESIRESLLKIRCWIFVHASETIPLSAAISLMVAEQHLKGQKPHTKIQQAHMLYDSYMGFLEETSGSTEFSKDADTVKITADFFGVGRDELELELAVVRLYKQLTKSGYEVPHKIRERLTWVHKNRGHFRKNFGYQEDILKLDSPGLERFNDIFIRNGCAVSSPALFSKFVNVMRYGKKSHIEILRTEPDQLAVLEQEVRDQRVDKRFHRELERIEKKVKGLRIGDYKETSEEDRLILNIFRMMRSYREMIKPTTPAEALDVSYGFLSSEIDAVLDKSRNSTCETSKIPSHLLSRWGINTKGRQRKAFCGLVEDALAKMEAEDRLGFV